MSKIFPVEHPGLKYFLKWYFPGDLSKVVIAQSGTEGFPLKSEKQSNKSFLVRNLVLRQYSHYKHYQNTSLDRVNLV
jgi:hypothetical protein